MLAKLFTLLLAALFVVNPYVAPDTSDPIKPLEDDVKLTAVAWADPQISNYLVKRYPVFKAAAEDLTNSTVDIDALILAGDITENGLQCEFNEIYNSLSKTPVKNFITATGNHDIRLKLYSQSRGRFVDFTNKLNANAGSELKIDKLNYSYEVNGYTFIVLGSDRTEFEEAYISPEQLAWLDSSLDACKDSGKPVFVVLHQTLKDTHGLPDTWGSPIPGGSVGAQSDDIYNILNKYSNVILITGHMHTGMGQYTYEKVGNFHSVNLPSTTIKNKDGEYNGPGIGYMMEVYEEKVVFRGRDFAKGVYVPEQDFTIEIG